MPTPTIQVTIVDATGVKQTFDAGRVDLDCGCGCIDIRPGKPAFYRDFEHGVLTLDDGTSVTTLNVTHGIASLSGNAVHILCEKALSGTAEATSSAPVFNKDSTPATHPDSGETTQMPSASPLSGATPAATISKPETQHAP